MVISAQELASQSWMRQTPVMQAICATKDQTSTDPSTLQLKVVKYAQLASGVKQTRRIRTPCSRLQLRLQLISFRIDAHQALTTR